MSNRKNMRQRSLERLALNESEPIWGPQQVQGGDLLDHAGGFSDLLLAHRGMAKFGGLRETPEGYLCLPAMALSKVALDCGMVVNVESEFFSQGYLEYLQQDR
jgi:hypothetical protein